MSEFITTANVQQYTTNVMMLLQQQGSRLRDAVQVQSLFGKAASVYEQFGSVTPVKNQARDSDTPLTSVPQDKRWIYPNDYDWATLIDTQDKLRLLIDPAGPYTMAGTMAMGRALDDEIINAFFGTAQTGENGSTATTFPSGQQVAVNQGASGNVSLSVAKLRAAKKLLMGAEVDIDNDPLYVAITAAQHDAMLNEIQATSFDFQSKPVLEEGRIRSFMGFNFIHSERLLLDGSGYTRVPCWAKSGMVLGVWNDLVATVDRRADKRNAWQVYLTETIGATRVEEKRVVEIKCNG